MRWTGSARSSCFVGDRILQILTLAATILGGMVTVHTASAGPLAEDHPVLGSWKMTAKSGPCSEIYRFLPDGTVAVTSGDEVAEVASEIASAPSPKGFYRWTQTIVKDNGKKDCSGKIARVGDAFTWFIQFDPSKQMMIVCKAEATDACFGPLHRIHGGGS
jgi:hypothetical protein